MTANVIARTGRVQSWIDNPESRLPVSCTVFVVDDSMEGDDGIEKSWRYVALLSAMELEWESTYPDLETKELKMARGWLLLAHARSQKSTQY